MLLTTTMVVHLALNRINIMKVHVVSYITSSASVLIYIYKFKAATFVF